MLLIAVIIVPLVKTESLKREVRNNTALSFHVFREIEVVY